MHKSVILRKPIKTRFAALVKELFPEYEVSTHDLENFQLETIIEEKPHTYYMNWSELAISEIPLRLGISSLIIPISDEDFNLAEYLVKYYEDMLDGVEEPIIKGKAAVKYDIQQLSIDYKKKEKLLII